MPSGVSAFRGLPRRLVPPPILNATTLLVGRGARSPSSSGRPKHHRCCGRGLADSDDLPAHSLASIGAPPNLGRRRRGFYPPPPHPLRGPAGGRSPRRTATPQSIGRGQRPESLELHTRGLTNRAPKTLGFRRQGFYALHYATHARMLTSGTSRSARADVLPSKATRALHYRWWSCGLRPAENRRLRPHRPTASALHIYSRFTFRGGCSRLPLGYYAFFWCDSPRSPPDGSKHPSDVTR